MDKAEKILAILEKHNVELPQAVLDDLNAAGILGDLEKLGQKVKGAAEGAVHGWEKS